MGETRDLNDPMIIYMNNLKVQINNKKRINNNNNNNNNKENSIVRSLNSDQSDSNSDDYESSNQSVTEITDINTLFDAQVASNSKTSFKNKIKKFRKY